MAKALNEDIITAIKELITHISHYEEGADEFNHIYRYFTSRLKKSDTMYFLNKKDVDQHIDGMSEKFCFHGFFRQSEALKNAYNTYIPVSLAKSDLVNRLNVVKFLLCMSDRPTVKFLENPEEYKTEIKEKQEEINWAEYLNEGIERWSPNFDESDDESYTTENDVSYAESKTSKTLSSTMLPLRTIKSVNTEVVVDLQTSREELLNTIQHTWYQRDGFNMKPQSDWEQANMGILWQEFLKDQVKCLVCLKDPSVITEYKVLREIIWQLFVAHNGSSFCFSGNDIIPKTNVTISSVREPAFQNYLSGFMPYIKLLAFFREFDKSMTTSIDNDDIPCTYRSYSKTLSDITRPVYERLCEVEEVIRKQETTYTLLKLSAELDRIFEPVKMLKRIHDEVIIDFKTNSPLICATTLLSRLHKSLRFTVSKLEQDIKLSLFLHTLYHYFRTLDRWLYKDDFADYSQEFIIEKVQGIEKWQHNYVAKIEVEDICKKDTLLKIIYEKVLQIGKDIAFLRMLGKYDTLNYSEETIHEEFIRLTLENLRKYYQIDQEEFIYKKQTDQYDLETHLINGNFAIPSLETKKISDMEKLENLVDTSDGFLMVAFADFFLVKPEEENTKIPTLFEQVSKITKNVFPKANFFEKIFEDILERRFKISGLVVKKLLIEQHMLEKHLELCRHLFLFSDDMIFPFYRFLFEKANVYNKTWGNKIWLTSRLQDILVDHYPEFYTDCTVQVEEDWKHCIDSLSACSLININYDISWPLDVIITDKQMKIYMEIFQFLLRLKWALYTLNHLGFSELEPSTKKFPKDSNSSKRCHKLRQIKFCVINILNSVQHFIFGFVLNKCLMKFELDFEKAYDLATLIESHANFTQSIFENIEAVRRKVDGSDKYKNILSCIKLLKLMWSNLEYATIERIEECHKMYRDFYNEISPIIFPTYIFDY